MSIPDGTDVQVSVNAVLRKFEGEPLPENEFERVTIINDEIVAHEVIENGEVVGDVPPERSLVGQVAEDITEKEEN